MNNPVILIICGHYGCGKTNLSINLALDYAAKGKPVTLVDLDLVNPYFRSSDYKEILEAQGVEVIAPTFAGTNLDLPSLSPCLNTVFNKEGIVIFDIGGDDAGATALGRFSKKIKDCGYDMVYVVNGYRTQIAKPDEALGLLHEIEGACGLTAKKVINNSHLMGETTAETILAKYQWGKKIAEALKLPLWYTTVPKNLENDPNLQNRIEDPYFIDIYVRSPWEQD